MDDIDKSIISYIQEEIHCIEEPFKHISNILKITEDEVIHRIERLIESGVIRRVGAILNHRNVGYSANAMVVWRISEKSIENIGKIMALQKEVSHCYKRVTYKNWPYNLYTMIHAKTKEECDETIEHISALVGISEYEVLYSTKELKKILYTYFK